MVKVQDALPVAADGAVDVDAWIAHVCQQNEHLDAAALRVTCEWLIDTNSHFLGMSLELAGALVDLQMDQESVQAALIYRLVRSNQYDEREFAAVVGAQASKIAHSVAAMAGTSLLEMSNSALLEKERQDQVENVRSMLAALIDDVRVAVVKLAERVLALRRAKNYQPERRHRIALEAQNIFAPLAGRLGIWQLKWELEDLSLRYTNEQAYQTIARQLKSKRGDREMQVEHMVDQVRGLLRGHGIDAEVFGRAKHIFSIWRKMQAKGVPLEQVYDVRAVRVVVGTLAECYAALGVIHNTWQHIPAEFDDYVATPKENGYRSIHTAVVASDERTLEIQIRTQEMHHDAELGVCAHWSYKGAGQSAPDFDAKMDWLRQVMEWHEELAGTERLSTLLRHRVSQQRIYVSTPKGHVLDMPVGSTVLDFAYRVHTDVGHACQSARINGNLAPLHQVLASGQQVEVLASGLRAPNRDWLENEFGYVITDRAKAKLTSY
ncbi:MAG: HD domain-containing protein, partial [Pseudomonadota bacterium]